MRTFSYLLLFILLIAACQKKQDNKGLPFFNTPDFTPVWLTPQHEDYDKIHTVSSFSLTNQLGNTISNNNTTGKIYVANFFFASCQSVCPPMMENLSKVAQTFAKDNQVLILSHSVTPRRDSISVLFEYAQKRHIDNNKWWLLTGEQTAIYKLARQSYFVDDATGYTKGSDDFLHTENLVLVDTKGRIRGVYNGSLQLEVNNLIEDIKLLKSEDI